MEMTALDRRLFDAFGDEALDRDLSSILMDRTGHRSPLAWLNDWWHRPEVERLWQPTETWKQDLKWYAVAIIALQLLLLASIRLREGSLGEDFDLIASIVGA